jgi:DMSO/TMAO reductase YedYZ heme-binding membrane subunit
MKNYYLLLITTILVLSILPGVMAVTPDGSTPAGDNMNIFITMLFIVATLGLFYTLFLTIAKLVTADETVYDVLLACGSFILLIIVNHLTAHYIEDVFMYNLSETFISLTPWTNIVLPIIAFVITIFIKGTQKKRPLSVAEIGGKLVYG